MDVGHDYDKLTPRTICKTDSEELMEFSVGCIAKLEYQVDGETQNPSLYQDSFDFVRWTVFEQPSSPDDHSNPGETGVFLLSGLGLDRAQAIRDMIVLIATLPAFITSVL